MHISRSGRHCFYSSISASMEQRQGGVRRIPRRAERPNPEMQTTDKVDFIGQDLNSSVGNDTKREKNEVAGPFGLVPTNSEGEDLINWCHEQSLSFVNSFFNHKRRGTWKCPARGTWHELDGFLVKQQQRSRLVKNVWTTSTRRSLTDHKPKVISCWLDKEKTRKHKPPTPKINWDNLRQGETKKMFQEKKVTRRSE